MSDQQYAQSIMEEKRKLDIAAGFEAERTAPLLFQILGHRKLAAQQLYKVVHDSPTGQELQRIIEYDNEKIKEILGL